MTVMLHGVVLAASQVNWTAVGIMGTLSVSLMGSLLTAYHSRKADRSAQFTKSMELGVGALIDQLQEERKSLRLDVQECKGECAALRVEVEDLHLEVERLRVALDDAEARNIGLKRRLGELR